VLCSELSQLADFVRQAPALARFGEVDFAATNQKVGSSTLSGRATFPMKLHVVDTRGTETLSRSALGRAGLRMKLRLSGPVGPICSTICSTRAGSSAGWSVWQRIHSSFDVPRVFGQIEARRAGQITVVGLGWVAIMQMTMQKPPTLRTLTAY